jgi:hypothetical protein
MRKLRVLLFSIVALLLLSAPIMSPVQPAKAAYSERHYVVHDYCVGPAFGVVCGEWTRRCDGSWDGWGHMPGQYSCCFYDMTIGETCDQ